MGQTIVKLNDGDKAYYLMWSSVVDAPVTYGMTLDEFKDWYKDEFGNDGMRGLPDRLARVEANGVSGYGDKGPGERFVAFNRAGLRETCLTVEQILDYYCRNPPEDGEPEREKPLGKEWTEDE